jgi:hypothetical protein
LWHLNSTGLPGQAGGIAQVVALDRDAGDRRRCFSSPVPQANQLLIRGERHLFGIGGGIGGDL